MKRRKFIEQSLKTIPALLIPSVLQTSCTKQPDEKPIISPKTAIVIGGGISGLAAAVKLKAAGLDVTVIESAAKVGGRLRTDRSLGFAFDEGASWIHGPSGNPITDLAAKAGANTYLTDDENLTIFDIKSSVPCKAGK